MKKTFILYIVLIAFLCFAGCESKLITDKDDNDYHIVEGYDDYIFAPENVKAFDVDENGNIYCPAIYNTGEVNKTEYNGEIYETSIRKTELSIFNKDGDLEKKYILDEENSISQIIYYDNAIYYITTTINGFNPMTPVLRKYDFNNEEITALYMFESYSDINKMVEINGKLYILGCDNEHIDDVVLYNEEGNYRNNGEIVTVYDIAKDKMSNFYDNFPVAIDKTPNDELMIYTYDKNGGYGFIKYSNKENKFYEKTYYDLKKLYNFSMISNSEFIYSSPFIDSRVIITSLNAETNIEIFDDIYLNNEFLCKNGNFYYIDINQSNKVKRVNLKDKLELRELGIINVISAEYVQFNPYSAGFNINREEIDYNSFALKVLSLDKNYDICAILSRQVFANSIKEKKSFYPLNDVEGVTEYIDSCFPFVKEAATDENGNIWMLPIEIDTMCVAYNELLNDSLGLGISENLTLNEFVGIVNSLYENGNYKAPCDIGANIISELALSQYLNKNRKFNTEEFRSLAELLKNEVFLNIEAFTISNEVSSILFNGEHSKMALTLLTNSFHKAYSNTNLFNVMPVPYIESGQKNISNCTFLCVNPNAENLDTALLYISALAKKLRADSSNLIIKDNALYESNDYYKNLEKINMNSVVRFSMEPEIFFDDFYKYVSDEITLEQFIASADEKLSIYLNE